MQGVRELIAAAVLVVAVGLAGCGFYNQSGPQNSFILHLRNDTRDTVTLEFSGGDKMLLAKGQGVFSYFPNDRPGVVRVQVVRGGKTLGCLTVPYRKGKKGKFVLVTAATPCASATHHGASHWVGVAAIAAVVLALLFLLGARLRVRSRVRAEWRVPIAFLVLWIVPVLVADTLFLRTHGRAAAVAVLLSLLLALGGAQAIVQRWPVGWGILVVIYVGGIAQWAYHVVVHGLGVAWALWGVLGFVNFALLVSAPMRRFVRLRGRLAPGPS
jgi:hypothetical protein